MNSMFYKVKSIESQNIEMLCKIKLFTGCLNAWITYQHNEL